GIVVSEPERFPIKDSLYGKSILSAQTNGRGAALTSQLTKTYDNGFYAKAQGTVKGYGDFEAPEYVLSNTGVRENALSAQFGLNKLNYGIDGYYSFFDSTIGILRASHIGGAEDQVAAINSERPQIIEDFTYAIDVPRQEVTHHLGKVSAFAKLKNLGKVAFQYDVQHNKRFEYDVRRTDDNTPSVDLELLTHTALLSLETNLTDNIHSKVGITGSFQENSANPNTGVRRLIPDYKQYKAGAFAITDVQFSDRLVGEAGIRLDHTSMDVFKFYRSSFWESRGYDALFPDLVVEDFGNQILTNPTPDFTNVSATLGASYKLNDQFTLFANYALASRAPNPSELFSEGLHHSASRIELGDLRFTSETSQKITATLQKKGNQLNFTVNPYVHYISDFILIEPTGIRQTIRGNFQVWEYRQTEARLMGVDFDLNYKVTDQLQYGNQISIVDGRDTSQDTALINMPPARITNSLVYDLPLSHPITMGATSTYVFEQTEFPDNNFEVFFPYTEMVETVDISTPPGAYHLLGFNVSTEFHTGKNQNLKLALQISNALDTSYRDYLNRLRYYADDLGRNIRLQIKYNY
ncbi:MAG: TonB-dependent receptor, partial [Marinirhabdus sp.]|nr:TonB-dependent receptor [Marinirhabdus sp.]